MNRGASLSVEQALQKARHYCAYQERCHSEVKEKLYSMGLRQTHVEEALAMLIDENYLNEQRFAIQFAGGRFRMKEWGKVRIRYELRQKKVSDHCIGKALEAIDGEAYERTLNRLSEERWEALRGVADPLLRRRKWQTWLLQKGYEADRIGMLSPAK